MKKFTNAYALVYTRDTVIDEVLAPFTEDDLPRTRVSPHLVSGREFTAHPRTKIG